MKKLFLFLFSFLFIGTALTGSAFLLSGCDFSYSQEQNDEEKQDDENTENSNDNSSSEDNNQEDANEDEDDEVSAQGYILHAYVITFDSQSPTGANNSRGGTVTVWSPGFLGIWGEAGAGRGTEHAYEVKEKDQGEVITKIKSGYTFMGYYTNASCTGTNYNSQFSSNSSYDNNASDGQISTGHFNLNSTLDAIYVKLVKGNHFQGSFGGAVSTNSPVLSSSYYSMNSSPPWINSTTNFKSASVRLYTTSSSYGLINNSSFTTSRSIDYWADYITVNVVTTPSGYAFTGIWKESYDPYDADGGSTQWTKISSSTTTTLTSLGEYESVYAVFVRMQTLTLYNYYTTNWSTISNSVTGGTFRADFYQSTTYTSRAIAGIDATISVAYSSTVKFTATAKSGYQFIGWYSAKPTNETDNRVSQDNPYSFTASSQRTIYAMFAKTYTLTIKYASSSVTHATSIKASCSAIGLNSSDVISGSSYAVTTYCRSSSQTITVSRVNGSYTYYMGNGSATTSSTTNSFLYLWSTKENVTVNIYVREQYKITYNGNGNTGGTVPGATYKAHGLNATLATNNLTKTGYTANGWNTNSSGTGTHYNNATSYSGNGNVTLFAQWAINTYTLTVKYYTFAGVSGNPTDLKITATSGNTVSGSPISVNESATVKHTYSTSAQTITIERVNTGASYYIDIGKVPTTSSSINTKTYSWTPTGNATINVYVYRRYSITYNANGGTGTVPSTQFTIHGTSIKLATNNLTKTAYNPNGWNNAADGSGTAYASGGTYAGTSGNQTMYAQWTPTSYTITYNGNNGSTPSKLTYNIESTSTLASSSRTGYTFNGWKPGASSGNWSSGTTYASGTSVKGKYGNVTLVAQWIAKQYTLTLKGNGGTPGTQVMSPKLVFDSGNWNDVAGNRPTKAGFTFTGFYTSATGGEQVYDSNGQCVNGTYWQDKKYKYEGDLTVYAHWQANLEAKYDTAGGYYYVEIGNMPQTRVTDSSLISQLNSSTKNGATYYINGTTMVSKKVNNVEYCKYGNNWYKVEPIRWRLAYSSSQKSGYGTTTDTFAVLDTIVYAGQYASGRLGGGQGYVTTTLDEFKKNITSTTYLANFSANVESYGTQVVITSKTANMFISSADEISNVLNNKSGSAKYSVKFSDLVSDILGNGINQYYTRNLGSNISNIKSYTELGMSTQNLCTNIQGVQFTIKVSEYGCV